MAKEKQSPQADDWQEVSIEFHKFEKEGDEVVGELVDKSITTMREGTEKETQVGKYTLVNPDGNKVAFLGGIQLDQLMTDVDVGTTIKLVFVGREPTTSGYKVKTFKLYTKPAK